MPSAKGPEIPPARALNARPSASLCPGAWAGELCQKLVCPQQESGLFPCPPLPPGEQDHELSGSVPAKPQGTGQTLGSRCSSPSSGVTLEATCLKSGVTPMILGFPEDEFSSTTCALTPAGADLWNPRNKWLQDGRGSPSICCSPMTICLLDEHWGFLGLCACFHS